MRVRSISLAALAAVAAGLSLTACDSNASTDGAGSPSSSVSASAGGSTDGATTSEGTNGTNGTGGTDGTQAPSGAGTPASGSTATGGSGNGSVQAAGGTSCQTAHLSFTASHGMGEGEMLINMQNTGAHACTMHGFPGADLKGSLGTVSAARSKVAAPHVTLQPGQETRFTLYYPANTSGGSGVTFTTLIVTPPNETHSHTMSLAINVPVSDSAKPAITVDPVGAGK
ncbi:DUF4232 domain-containing protein [Actinacidiphila acidipaludis]|uniref:DUF4232 domain-containing protein n=1 Tax=Actinacidiphila acidipaludis TaxID=2873382 RepID=A0ABS7Q2W5_9ACTN|nr:DUF4232 domain-containing protein [Streptomyces acidipaludis]MBY8877493.1 DUF4232 domain-containing protein [Streptomyces acidipaludis]